jgi:autotransporter-associated beta strand protein
MKAFTTILISAAALAIFNHCANAQTLFDDTYSRGGVNSAGNLTPNFIGQSGADVGSGLTYTTFTNSANTSPPNSLNIQNGTLFKSQTGQEGIWAPNYNFTDAAIVSAGGFSVSQNIIGFGSVQDNNHYCGYGVGMSAAQVVSFNDETGTSLGPRGSPSSLAGGSGTTGVAAFYVDLDSVGDVQVFTNGILLASIAISGDPHSGLLQTVFAATSFNVGSTVNFTVFFSGTQVTNGTFLWNSTGNNYVAGSMRASTVTAGEFNVTAGLVTNQVLDSWVGGTADYNTPADWSSGTVPLSWNNADNDNGSNNVVQINSGDPNWTVNDICAGNSTGSGAYVQNGQTVTVNGWFRLGIASGLTGVYTLAGGTLNYGAGNFNVGESGTGILNVNGGSINGTSGNFGVPAGENNSGLDTSSTTSNVLTQTAGIISITGSGQFFIGDGNGPAGSGIGFYNISGGTNTVNSYFAIGRSGGYGTVNMTGGVINENNGGVLFDVGTGFQANSPGAIGILNQSGGTINCAAQFLIPEDNPSTGTYNLSGTGSLIVHNWFVIGRAGATGVMNMSGGSLLQTNTEGPGDNFEIGEESPGTLNQSGGSITLYNQLWIGQNNTPQAALGTYNMSGGSLTVNDWLAIGRAGGTGYLNLTNGTVTQIDFYGKGNDNSDFTVGSGGPGTINQYGGSITTTNTFFLGETAPGVWNINGGSATLGTLELSVHSGVNSTLNLNGGTLQTSGIQVGNATGISSLYFNGGTLQANTNNANFLSGLYQAFSGPNGPAVIDSQNYNITVGQQIQDNGSGLVKLGSGTLTLTGANSYTGNTVVSNGALIVTTSSSPSGNYAVEDNTTLGIVVESANAQLDAQQNATLGNSAGASLDFNLGGFGNPSSAPLNVGGTLTANGTITINIADTFPQVGQFPLIQSGSPISGSGHFVLGPLPTGVAASLVVTANTVSLNITGVNLPVWEGLAGGTWDLGSDTNWYNLGTGLPTTFANGNVVLFDDTALGTTNVNITTTVSPGSVTVNNTNLSYTFYGSGSISGSGGLTKEAANSLAILNTTANSYIGPTVISGGTLLVSNLANGGSPSAIGSSSASPTNLVLSGGALAYTGPAVSINRSYTAADTNGAIDIITVSNLTLSGTVTDVSGSGFNKSGPAQLAYANTNLNVLSDVLGYSVDEGSVVFGSSGTDDISGNFDIGSSNAIASTVDITNTALVNLLTGGDLDIADSYANGTTNYGAINQSGGVLNVPGGYQTWIGNNTNGIGTYNLSGGTFNANNWVAVGRDNGNGTFNLSGTGALNIVNGNGGNLDIGTSGGHGGAVGTGVLNQTGGTITNTASETWLGEGAAGQPVSGTWNMSGGMAQLGELHIGVGGTGTSTLNISGSASITESYLLLANYDTNTTGNVNVGSVSQPGGTITVNADMNVGGDGFGTLTFVTNGGGMVTVTGTLYLSRFDPTADGTVNLNAGGTLVVSYINNGWAFNEGTNSPTFNPNAFNFNGGTLRAFVSSESFIQQNVNAVVQSGGAIIDDGGYSVWADCAFNDAPGSTAGLTKLGSGTLNLTATNTYTGTTVVSNGTLVANSLAGGITVESGATLLAAGSVAGPVIVASGGTLGGTNGIGTESFNSTLSLAAGSTTFAEITPASNDQIVGLTGVTYGGSLIVSNISSSPLTVGNQYQLFHSSSPGTGNFTSVTLLPAGAATFNPSTGILTITSIGTAPVFNRPYVSSGSLVLTATGGTPGANLSLLSSTNLLTPIPNWTTNYNGAFDSNGNFSNAVPISSTNPVEFFILKTP